MKFWGGGRSENLGSQVACFKAKFFEGTGSNSLLVKVGGLMCTLCTLSSTTPGLTTHFFAIIFEYSTANSKK